MILAWVWAFDGSPFLILQESQIAGSTYRVYD